MKPLREVLEQSRQKRVAIGHFNISDLVTLNAVIDAARELDVPVLVGISEGEREFFGVRKVSLLVRSIRDEYGFPVFLNADHTYSLAKAVEAARAGFDAIVYDRSSLSFDQNVEETKRAVEVVKSIDSRIIVEGEIGNIGSGSEIHDTAPPDSRLLSTPEEARQFANATRIDVLAPAVGNMHGLLRSMVQGAKRKRLDIGRIAAIRAATDVFLTLHGGSGTAEEDLKASINAGINIIHINTELRVAWRRGIEAALTNLPNEIAPYKLLPAAVEAVRTVAYERLRLFGSGQEAQGHFGAQEVVL